MNLEETKQTMNLLNTADRVQLMSILSQELPREQNLAVYRRLDEIRAIPEADEPLRYSAVPLQPILMSAGELSPHEHMALVLHLFQRIPQEAIALCKERINYRESQFRLEGDSNEL